MNGKTYVDLITVDYLPQQKDYVMMINNNCFDTAVIIDMVNHTLYREGLSICDGINLIRELSIHFPSRYEMVLVNKAWGEVEI